MQRLLGRVHYNLYHIFIFVVVVVVVVVVFKA